MRCDDAKYLYDMICGAFVILVGLALERVSSCYCCTSCTEKLSVALSLSLSLSLAEKNVFTTEFSRAVSLPNKLNCNIAYAMQQYSSKHVFLLMVGQVSAGKFEAPPPSIAMYPRL